MWRCPTFKLRIAINKELKIVNDNSWDNKSQEIHIKLGMRLQNKHGISPIEDAGKTPR